MGIIDSNGQAENLNAEFQLDGLDAPALAGFQTSSFSEFTERGLWALPTEKFYKIEWGSMDFAVNEIPFDAKVWPFAVGRLHKSILQGILSDHQSPMMRCLFTYKDQPDAFIQVHLAVGEYAVEALSSYYVPLFV